MNKNTTMLEARVEAVNNVYSAYNNFGPRLRAIFSPFVGQKILKADGSLMQKVKAIVPAKPDGFHSFYQSDSTYSLSFVLTACVGYGDHSCVYENVSIYVGNLDNGVLTEISKNQDEPLRANYTVAEVESLRVQAQLAAEVARQTESACNPFGLIDRR